MQPVFRDYPTSVPLGPKLEGLTHIGKKWQAP